MKIKVDWCFLWFILASEVFPGSVALVSRIPETEKEKKEVLRSMKMPCRANHITQKRWLRASFRGMKKKSNEPRKWYGDNEVLEPNSQSSEHQWMSKKRNQNEQMYRLADMKPNDRRSYLTPTHYRKHGLFANNIPSKQKLDENLNDSEMHKITNSSEPDRSDNSWLSADSQLPKPSAHRKPFPAYLQRKEENIKYPSALYQETVLKLEPMTNSILSSIAKWYTTPAYGSMRSSELPLKNNFFQEDQLSTSINQIDVPLKNKGLAKVKYKKSKEGAANRGRFNENYEFVPKIYVSNKIDLESDTNANDGNGSFGGMRGFDRKDLAAREHRRPYSYVVHAEEPEAPSEHKFVQLSRSNRNQSRNAGVFSENMNGNAVSGVPMQLPSPYAIPGGVNISILVPNPPPAYSNDVPPSTLRSPAERDKNLKRKKMERRKKIKDDEDSLLFEPRSLVSASANQKARQNFLRFNGMQNKSTPNNTIQYSSLDTETNFNLFNHIQNASLDQIFWHRRNEKIDRDSSEYKNINDEMHIYEEPLPSTNLFQSYGKTYEAKAISSFSKVGNYYRLFSTEPTETLKVADSQGRKEASDVSNMKGYYNENINNIDSTRKVDWEQLKRSVVRGTRNLRLRKTSFHENLPLRKFINKDYKDYNGAEDQWDVLDETLRSEVIGNGSNEALQATNRKREADYDNQANDEVGYYRLTPGGNSFRNPANLIMSVFRGKPDKYPKRDYYDDVPEGRIREEMRPRVPVQPKFPL